MDKKNGQKNKVLVPINEEELTQQSEESKSIEIGCETSVDTLSLSEQIEFKFKKLTLNSTTRAE